jgi:uncharacterized protein (TIGR03437 family)
VTIRTFGLLLLSLISSSCALHRQAAIPPLASAKPDLDARALPEDQPDDALEFFRAMRMPGKEPLSPERYETARAHAESMRHYSIATGQFVNAPNKHSLSAATPPTTLGPWESLGPGNIGGRTRSLVIHPTLPNTMYAGAVAGGVWRTTDAGVSWAPLTDLSANIAISSLVMDPRNPSVLYAGTGEGYNNIDAVRGMGILKTSDGGTTWTSLAATANSQFYYVNRLAFGGAHNLYAATNTGVYRSTDGGATWTQSLNLPNCLEMAARADTTTDTIFASCVIDSTFQVGIYRNTDAGGAGTWTQVFTAPNMARTSLAIAPSQPATIYAMAWSVTAPVNATGLIGVFRSTASGDTGTWTTQTSNASTNRLNTALLNNLQSVFGDVCYLGGKSDLTGGQGWYGNTLAVDPVNPNVVWAGGVDTFRSDDGGANWGVTSYWNTGGRPGYAHADIHGFVFKPGYNGTTNQTLYLLNDGGIYRSDNSRAATQTGMFAACPVNAPTLLWTNLNHGYAVTQFYNGLPYPGGAFFFGGAQDNGSIRSGGATNSSWSVLQSGDGGWVGADRNNPNTIFTEYVRKTTYRSDDGGINFNQITNGITENDSNFLFIKQMAMDPNNAKLLYVGGLTLWRTLDGGNNWSAASNPVPAPITAIAIAPSNSNTVYFADTLGHVYSNSAALTANQTTAWSFTTPRLGAAVSALAVSPTNPLVVYAVYSTFKQNPGDNHIYVSTDGGITWTGRDGTGTTGIPDVPVNSFLIDPQNELTVYAGTDLGIYLSFDSAVTWSRDANPFANTGVASLSLERGNGTPFLYAFTHGRSAWRTPIPNTGQLCTYQLDTTALVFPAAGGTLPVTVTTKPACTYSAIPTAGVAEVASPAALTGPGQIFVSMAGLNADAAAATDAVLIQGQTVTVTQTAAAHTSLTLGKNDETSTATFASLPYGVLVDPGYTSNTSDPVHSCTNSADTGTSWWKLVAPGTGQIQLEQVNGAVLSAYTVLSTGARGPEIAGSCLDGTGIDRGTTQFNVTANSIYLIEVSSRAAAVAPLGLGITYIPNTYITVTTPKSTLSPGQSVQASTTVAGPDNKSLRWSITPEIGSITTTGLYTAPATLTGSVQVIITATSYLDDGDFGSTTVIVNGTPAPGITMSAAGITSAASNLVSAVVPGELITIYGAGFGPAQLTTLALGPDGKVATSLAGTQVLFDGVPAPMIYAANGQVSAVAPFGIAAQPMTVVQVKSGSVTSAPALLPVAPASPAIFTADSSGSGTAAILNQDGSRNSAQNPAPKGSVVVFYATGGGLMQPAQIDGGVTSALSKTALAASVTIGGVDAAVGYLGGAPGLVVGVLQANVTVPANAPSGSVPLVVTIGGVSSPATVTIFVAP